jgi:zinc protease
MNAKNLILFAVVAAVGRALFGSYVVAVEKGTYADCEWKKEADALVTKHHAMRLEYDDNGNLASLLPGLKKVRPRYVCFVSRPETAGRDLVVGAAQLLRRIDDDPYGDAMWGILTGYEAADAMRIVKSPCKRVIRRAATSMGSDRSLDGWEAGFASNEGNKDDFWLKRPGAPVERLSTGGDPAKALANAFNTIDVDYFVTSGHATQRDWQIIYNKNEGSLRHDERACLRFMNPKGDVFPVVSASPKIYLAAGNCLIGNVDRRDCMATAWMHTGGVEQMCGYTAVTFFGFMGWGIKSHLEEGRCSFAEAYYLQNQMLLWALANTGEGLQTRRIDPGHFGGGGSRVATFVKAHADALAVGKDRRLSHTALGLLWDRDIVAFYGDPAQRVLFPGERRALATAVKGNEVRITFLKPIDFGGLADVKSARPVVVLVDGPVEGSRLVDANGREVPRAVVNDRFVLVPVAGSHAAGESLLYRIVR